MGWGGVGWGSYTVTYTSVSRVGVGGGGYSRSCGLRLQRLLPYCVGLAQVS